jgi:5'-3' exonuclease
VDGLNIAFRAWAAMSQRPLTTSDGIPTTIAFNFMRTLGNAIVAEKPRYVCVVFDAPKGSASR